MTEDEWERLSEAMKKMHFNAILPLVGSRYIRFYDPDMAEAVQESGKAATHKIQTNDPKDPFPIDLHRGIPNV